MSDEILFRMEGYTDDMKFRKHFAVDKYPMVKERADIILANAGRKSVASMVANIEVREFMEKRGMIKDADEVVICIRDGHVCEVLGLAGIVELAKEIEERIA